MSQQHWVRGNDGDFIEITGRVQFLGDNPGTDGFVQHAEEGTPGNSSMRVDDEDGTFNVRGHRLIYSKETLAAADDFGGVFGVGYTGRRDIVAGHPWDGVGRVWDVEIDDINTVLYRRKLLTNAKRPAETDVARAQWVFGRPELLSAITDDTYLSTADPVMMSKADYTKQSPSDVLDDCAQQSSKNWYVMNIDDPFTFSLWYGAGSLETFVSTAVISASTGYAPADGTKISIDPTRIASGVIVDYDSAYVYRTRPQTATDFAIGGRDVQQSAPNVKTKAQAIARAMRLLADLSTEEYTIETGIVVAPADVNVVRHGHRVQFQIPWAPDGLDELTWTRVLRRTVLGLAPGTDGKYEIALTLVTDAPVASGGACTGLTETGEYPPLGGEGNAPNESGGNVFYLRPGIEYPQVVTPAHQGSWHFPVYGAGGSGTVDQAGDCGQNIVRCLVVGDGEIEVHTSVVSAARNMTARLMHADSGSPSGVIVDEVQTGESGDTFTFTVSTHDGAACEHWVDVSDNGDICGGKWGFDGFDWTAAA